MPGVHDVMINFWKVFPSSLQGLFMESFTRGLHDPEARVMDKEWCKEMSSLRDSIFECRYCEAENFFNLDRVKRKQALDACWACGRIPELPARMRISGAHGARLVMISKGAQLFPHHLDGDENNFTAVLAEVINSPLALRNRSSRTWSARISDGTVVEVKPGGLFVLTEGCRIHFGRTDAEVKL